MTWKFLIRQKTFFFNSCFSAIVPNHVVHGLSFYMYHVCIHTIALQGTLRDDTLGSNVSTSVFSFASNQRARWDGYSMVGTTTKYPDKFKTVHMLDGK